MMQIVSAIFSLALGLSVLNVSQSQEATRPMSRAKALRTLKGCATRPITRGCSEDTAGYVIKLYEHGDQSVLRPLLDAGLISDAALSEILGDFYAHVLWKSPREFLDQLNLHSKKEKESLCRLAATTDGSGMGGDMLRDVRRKLNQIRSQHGRLAPLAGMCLFEVNKANATTQ
jgi:hypothetical protein